MEIKETFETIRDFCKSNVDCPKSYMSEVAKMLGVNIGEEFIIENADRKETVVLDMDGLRVPFPHGMSEMDDGRLLLKVLQGHYDIVKLPWTPKYNEPYWTMIFYSDGKPFTRRFVWSGHIEDFTNKALDKVYRTREEAEANLSKDYERLTGKKLHENA